VIAQAALYLAAPDDTRAALRAVAGRPVAYRVVLSAVRAGARRVALPPVFRGTILETAVAASPAARRAVVWLDEQPLAAEPTLLLPATALTLSSAIGRLLEAGPSAVLAESRDDGALAIVADAGLLAATAGALAGGIPLGNALERAMKDQTARVVHGDAWYVRVDGGHAAAEVERHLSATLGSPIDTALDRALHRRLSRHVSGHAIAWGVTPNQVTLASLVVGLAAVACFWHATPASALLGLALYVGAVVLDHADGEVARLTLAESASGEWLDVAVDTLVHALLVAAMGTTAQAVADAGAALGAVGALGVVASAASAKAWPGPTSTRLGTALLQRLGARDSFYAILIAFLVLLALWPAALGPFMAVVAVGAHLYWISCLLWRRASRAA
jgi:phosphatidylglycerophosphate synthase